MTEHHRPCPDCGSSDALTINDDGSTKCFSCGKFTNAPAAIPDNTDFIKGRITAISNRCLTYEACEKYRYMVSSYNGREVHIAPYRDLKGNPVFQKIRFTDEKGFKIIGTFKPLLFGANLWTGRTKKIIITEGEIDCLSAWQAVGDYPVVSVPNGANGAKNAIQANLKWLERFDEVVFMFDSDEAGRAGANECAALLSIGKAKIVNLPLKDPNEMIKAGREKELYTLSWNGAEYRPDGIISGDELWSAINKPVEWGLSYPFDTLTRWTYGIRTPEFICIGAGTGMGKTDFFKTLETHLATYHQIPVGIIHLEETTRETVLGLMTKYSGIKFHLPDTVYTEQEKKDAYNAIKDKVQIYDSFGSTDLDTIINTIRYMVKAKNCRYIFLDHITAMGDSIERSADVNQRMRNIVSELARLTRELDFTLFAISHLRKSDGTPHEEGGRVRLDDLYGAKAIAQWATFIFGLERDQQAEDLEERHTTTLRCLKDRYTGQATGCTVKLKYCQDTATLYEKDDIIPEPEEEKEELF